MTAPDCNLNQYGIPSLSIIKKGKIDETAKCTNECIKKQDCLMWLHEIKSQKCLIYVLSIKSGNLK